MKLNNSLEEIKSLLDKQSHKIKNLQVENEELQIVNKVLKIEADSDNIPYDGDYTCDDCPYQTNTSYNPNKDISGKNALVVSLEVVIEGIKPPMINPNPNRPSTLLETMGVKPIFLIAINGS